jgi:hypothetical protein
VVGKYDIEAVGWHVDIVPIHPKMAGLVKAAAELAGPALARKRAPRLPVDISPELPGEPR